METQIDVPISKRETHKIIKKPVYLFIFIIWCKTAAKRQARRSRKLQNISNQVYIQKAKHKLGEATDIHSG